ncbi:MAG: cyclic nucleotide-binding domain-containing protein [Myxococcota bacterium]
MSDEISRALMDGPSGQILNSADAAEIAGLGATRTVQQGEVLFGLGDPADALCFVLDGRLEVRLGSDEDATRVASLGPGQLAGELEAMTRTLRVASVVAEVDTRILELPISELDRLLEENRASGNRLVQVIAKTLARRLAAVNQRLTTRAHEPASAEDEVVEIVDTDVTIIDEGDLDVLDRLWSTP